MDDNQTNLRNDDFRKLLTTRSNRPAASLLTESAPKPSANFRHKQPKPAKFKKPAPAGTTKTKKEKDEADEDEARLKDIMKNYRDRAAERRKQGDQPEDMSKLTAAYRAVPGDPRTARDQADLRKQAILESKYLGGDIEHTHLVKGLDYSLLTKVRSEITNTVQDEDEDIEAAFEEGNSKTAQSMATEMAQSQSENRMVRSMHRILFKNEIPLKNDMFAKGRMAYVVELEDEEADIPTTLLRSLHDCPRAESAQSIQANNLIISKLTKVLTYLRADKQKKKKEVEVGRIEEKEKERREKPKGDSIYDDIDDYVPSRRHRSRSRERDDRRDRERDRDRREYRDHRDHRDRGRDDRASRAGEYFEKPSRRDERESTTNRRDREKEREKEKERKEREEMDNKTRKEAEEKEREKRMEEKLEKRRKETESAGYDECYPGGMVEMSGGWDSDEETDFSKMDMGTKKNGLNRWDFDTQEEYADYMGGREALPKAAYQYGVKTAEGRKTRKTTVANDNKKLDRELNEINKIMEKRKVAAAEGRSDYKKPKY